VIPAERHQIDHLGAGRVHRRLLGGGQLAGALLGCGALIVGVPFVRAQDHHIDEQQRDERGAHDGRADPRHIGIAAEVWHALAGSPFGVFPRPVCGPIA
jgi:hypothetical protein